jgi:hypothetical protein
MPGLIRGVARTAVVAGTATAVSNRVSRRQASRWAQQEDYYGHQQGQYYSEATTPTSAPSQEDKLKQLRQLGDLKTSGVLTAAEFEAQKAKILAG